MKIDDPRLLKVFDKADNCVKIDILRYFDSDISPIATGALEKSLQGSKILLKYSLRERADTSD
jgi:hypothetical protein